MAHTFDCIATGVGSLPATEADKAVALSLSCLPEAPIWPQLPTRSFHEHMDIQYCQSLPGLLADEGAKRFSFDTTRDLTPELEKFFDRYLAKDYEFFRMTEDFAAGFYAFLKALKAGGAKEARFLKGHVTGPLTMGTSFKDESGKDIIHNELLFDALVKGLAMKAAWQIERLAPFGKPVIIFIDEPAMESLGSAFSSVSPGAIAEKLNEIVDAIHELGGISGVHCCGNADWSMLFNTRVDVVNFDAFGYSEKVLLYPADIKTFLSRGGALAWGIVPTLAFTGSETVEGLVERLEAGFARLQKAGIDRATLLHQSIITPSCGLGSLAPEKVETILGLLRGVSDTMKRRI